MLCRIAKFNSAFVEKPHQLQVHWHTAASFFFFFFEVWQFSNIDSFHSFIQSSALVSLSDTMNPLLGLNFSAQVSCHRKPAA